MTHTLASFLITPDGTKLQSYNRHDYKTHHDQNGEVYMIDGGCEYQRTSANKEPAEYFTVTTDDTHKVKRQHFHWGTRGKDGMQPLTFKPLMGLDTEHIEAILETQHHIPQHIRELFEAELEYRSDYYPVQKA